MAFSNLSSDEPFLRQHRQVTRRYFLRVGAGGLALVTLARPAAAQESSAAATTDSPPAPSTPVTLGKGVKQTESLLTPPERFFDVSRGDPLPHSLPEETKRQVGLTRETWQLEVISDPEHPARLRQELTRQAGTALDFVGLMQLAEKHAVRFAKLMTCLNLGCPLGFGIWEGVPLREVIALAEPRDHVRRVFYYGYHNDRPEQMFRSSLPLGRVLEDPFDLPPVILCYKLNGHWLSSERGGPVRVVVPEAYGFKSVKWLTHVVLSDLPYANDTYAEQGNDIDSPLKSFAATMAVPDRPQAGQPLPVSGYAQVGIGGLSRVQAWLAPDAASPERDDPYFTRAPWIDMEILPPPEHWGGGLAEAELPRPIHGFDPATGRPRRWPLRLGMVHWAGVLPGVPAGTYTLRCRAIDEKGLAQPLPRPMRRSGHAEIEQVRLVVS